MLGHGIIMTIIIGLVCGGLAKMVMPGNNPVGWIVTLILGIAGSFVGSYIAHMLGFADQNLIIQIIFGVIGAAILLAIWHYIQRAQSGS
ncbi:MAG: GlsB/YeaQ/YmgE family stress response membrane protein [Alphaproteobacteria bacterium]|nr:GlsB/YeaQ/YmgE family stress response membrane protein [Alphaproteobacteria bacterium]MDE2340084.1 GlsB/YeaQ/YmgE family stress response membrane protein [Alphaproteobacteria bacterium]